MAVRGDHNEAMIVTMRTEMRSYPTQEMKSKRGTGVGASGGKGAREKH